MCLVCYDIEHACQRSQPPYAPARPHASKGSFLEAFIPSISASTCTYYGARFTRRIFPGDRVVYPFRVCLPFLPPPCYPPLPSHLLTIASLHSSFFILPHPTPTEFRPFSCAGRARVFYPPRLEWIATILAHLALFAQMRRILNALAALHEQASLNCWFTRQRGRL